VLPIVYRIKKVDVKVADFTCLGLPLYCMKF